MLQPRCVPKIIYHPKSFFFFRFSNATIFVCSLGLFVFVAITATTSRCTCVSTRHGDRKRLDPAAAYCVVLRRPKRNTAQCNCNSECSVRILILGTTRFLGRDWHQTDDVLMVYLRIGLLIPLKCYFSWTNVGNRKRRNDGERRCRSNCSKILDPLHVLFSVLIKSQKNRQ